MLEIWRGEAATRALASQTFQRSWTELYQACPWGTVYQDIPFVTAWYRCYSDEYEPVVVCETATAGTTAGLLFLAGCRGGRALLPCGTAQAEYDVWLARPARASRFIEAAWTALARQFPHSQLGFLFVPPNVPLALGRKWQARCFVNKYKRPLLSTSPSSDVARAALSKKGNRNQLTHVQRMGSFDFRRITDPVEFDAFLDEMIPLFDTRQLALSGTAPFRSDPRLRPFLHELLRQKTLHVTAMRVAGRLVAAHVGQINRGQVVFGMVVHSPFLAKHSVGKLQLLLVAVALQQEGYDALDLTPIGDYKDRFATHHDEVKALTVCMSARSAARYRLRRAAIGLGKRFMSPAKAKELIALAKHKWRLLRLSNVPAMLRRRVARAFVDHREFRVYVMTAAAAAARPRSDFMRRDQLDDLLLYEPAEAWQPPRDAFMRTCLARLGSGQHFYSRIEEGRLAHWGWLVDHQVTSEPAEVDERLLLPVRSAVLFDFYTRPEYRGRGLYGRALEQCITDAGRVPGGQHVAISVLASNVPSRRAIEKAGFTYWRSLFRRRALWHTRRWRTQPSALFSMPPMDASQDG